jgi:O-succinylbenzoic acid--CoA ligase
LPTALQRIDPRKFRAILLGGSKPPTDRPKNVIATYGLTETGSGIVYDGRPLDGVEIKIAEDDEILVRSAMNMRCYRDGSSSVDADGWLHTGDIGWVSDNGVLNVQGRRGDVIVTGSEKVWPEAVEISIASLFKPNQFAVIGIPDSEWGERVVVATTRTDIVLSDIKDLVLKTLPNYCVPKSIHVVESIPQTAIGKIRRVALRQQLSANN